MLRFKYEKGDYYFWIWWKTIYKKDLGGYESWYKVKTIPKVGSNDFFHREKLQAYYHGLCDGRKRICDPY